MSGATPMQAAIAVLQQAECIQAMRAEGARRAVAIKERMWENDVDHAWSLWSSRQ